MTAHRRVLVARAPVDFRQSIDSLTAVCEIVLREQPLDGTLLLFVNRSRDAMKDAPAAPPTPSDLIAGVV